MALFNLTTALATEEDASALAEIMTEAFAPVDASFHLTWDGAAPGIHTMMARKLFEPVQKEGQVSYKAVEESTGRMVGFATWMMPRKKVAPAAPVGDSGAGFPDIPGVNMGLLGEKLSWGRGLAERHEDVEKDMKLAFFFVHPEYQRRGIGNMLLQWGKEKADELGAKMWVSATPQATPVYLKNGWEIVEQQSLDLSKYGGEGVYVRSWMLRKPSVK